MKSLILIASLLFSFLSTGQLSDEILQKLNRIVDSLPEGTTISMSLITNDKPTFIGLTKIDGDFIYCDLSDSTFEIGSLTKTFTSTVLADLVVNDKLCLDKKVHKEYSYKWKNKIKISYLNLANHTSGMYRLPSNIFPSMLKNQDDPYANYTPELLEHYLEYELQLENPIGEKYAYSNLGAGVLAHTLSLREAKSIDELIHEKILSPFGMKNTGYDLHPDIMGLNSKGDTVSNWHFNAMKGAGGLISNTEDLSKYVMAQFNDQNEVLALTRESTFDISSNMSIGLGWHIISPNTEDLKYWHNGGTGGYTSSITFRTSNETGVIILSNISALNKFSAIIDEICFDLLEELN